MPTTSFDKESIKQSIIGKLQRYNGRTIAEATPQQIYKAVASTVRDQIMQKWMIAREERKTSHAKRLYYLSVEFLMGRSLYNNMLNLVSTDVYTQALKELGIDSVPLNMLTPIPGTPFENNKPLPPLEILRAFAVFRFVLPKAQIRTAGGREVNLRDLQALALNGGASGIMIGGYLTTAGRGTDRDMQMLKDLDRPRSVPNLD